MRDSLLLRVTTAAIFVLLMAVSARCEGSAEPDVDVEQLIVVAESGTGMQAEFSVVTSYSAAEAAWITERFADGADVVGDDYLGYMQSMYPGMQSLGPPTLSEPDDAGRVRVSERYRWMLAGSRPTELPVVLFQLMDWVPHLPAQGDEPVVLAGPAHGRQVIRVSHSDGWNIESETDRVETPFFEFSREVAVENGALRIEGHWRRRADEIPVAEIDALRQPIEHARELGEYWLEFGGDFDVLVEGADWRWPLAGVVLAMLIVACAWAGRARRAWAGMFFRPRRTIAGLLERPVGLGPVVPLLLAFAVLTMLFEQGAEYVTYPSVRNAGAMLGAVVGGVVRMLLATGLTWLGFRLWRVRANYDRLLVAQAWATLPGLALLVAGLLALGGRIRMMAESYQPQPEEFIALATAGLLLIIGTLWMVVATIGAYAAAAPASIGRTIAAMLSGVLVLLAPLLLILFLLR